MAGAHEHSSWDDQADREDAAAMGQTRAYVLGSRALRHPEIVAFLRNEDELDAWANLAQSSAVRFESGLPEGPELTPEQHTMIDRLDSTANRIKATHTRYAG